MFAWLQLGSSPTQVAEDIGVTSQTIRNWVRKFGKEGSEAFPARASYPAGEEPRQMKTTIKDLEEESLILGLLAKTG